MDGGFVIFVRNEPGTGTDLAIPHVQTLYAN